MGSDFFDASISTYLATMRTRNFESRERAFAKAARIAYDQAPGVPVCVDLGVGTGYLTRTFADIGFDVVGCDTSDEMLKVARTEVPTADLQRSDIAEFVSSQPPASADLVVCSSVLEYVSDPVAVVRAAVPVLQIGGILAVSLPERRSVSRLIEAIWKARVPPDQRYGSEWRNRLDGRTLIRESERVCLELLYRERFGSFEWRRFRLPFEHRRPIATLVLCVFRRHA